MASMYWPPEKAIRYGFKEKEELTLGIPLISNKLLKKAQMKKPEDDKGRD